MLQTRWCSTWRHCSNLTSSPTPNVNYPLTSSRSTRTPSYTTSKGTHRLPASRCTRPTVLSPTLNLTRHAISKRIIYGFLCQFLCGFFPTLGIHILVGIGLVNARLSVVKLVDVSTARGTGPTCMALARAINAVAVITLGSCSFTPNRDNRDNRDNFNRVTCDSGVTRDVARVT